MIALLITFLSCNRTQPEKSIEEIDLFGAYQMRSEVPVSNIASEIEYIRLETGNDFMVGNPNLINVKDSLILFTGFRKLYVFNRFNGKFLYEISSFGRGPDEYSSTGRTYDEDEDLFFVSLGIKNGYQINVGYNFNGKIIKTVSIPGFLSTENDELPIARFWPLSDSLYLGYADNPMVNISEKLVVFSRNGEFIKSYPNYNTIDIEDSGSFSFSAHKGMFFNAEDTVRFFELHTDTVFNISSRTIEPRYHISMGDLLLPYNLRASINSPEYFERFHIRTMFESSRFLMFSVGLNGFRYIACYDKTLKRTMVCNNSEDLDFYKFSNYNGLRCIGFSNDLDQFIPIGTDKQFYINKNDEFVTAIPALEVKRWFDKNPEKAAKLPEHLRNFEDIDNEDNPVVVVVKLKK